MHLVFAARKPDMRGDDGGLKMIAKPDDTNQYVTDVLNLNASLEAVATGDDLHRITGALIQGKEQYFDLVFRRLSLDFRPKDDAILLWMMDIAQARLASLERLRYQKLPQRQRNTALRKSRHTGSWL
ncbi:MAG TPA: hypothetical protein VKT75_07975 [Acidobacteriaceae bacterium]|nr:hypothetical protein [Acidobacteriaceae bacterium]